MDPVTLALVSGAVGGAGGKAVETLWQATGQRWLTKYLEDVSEEARAVGQANTVEFLSQLALRLGKLEERLGRQPEELVERSLRDPDLLVTFNTALLSSARTSEQVKHDVLARTVAERFVAAPDSLSALAANIAAETIPRLSSTHLQLLAVAAVIYVIRPPGLPVAPSDALNFTDQEASLVKMYGSWLKNAVDHVLPASVPSDLEFAHLAAAACITLERGLERDLRAVLSPARGRTLSMAASSLVRTEVTDAMRTLAPVWAAGMMQLTLTPPGILVGVAAYDHACGEETELDWSNPNLTQSVRPTDYHVWDGWHINQEFFRKLGEEIVSSAERGVQPWTRLTWQKR
jgi:hypothetical protein